MQLKNNQTRNVQLFYTTIPMEVHVIDGKEVKKPGASKVEYIHIPAGATVEIDDAIFKQLCAPLTRVEVQKHSKVEIESEVPILVGGKPAQVHQFESTGEYRHVNLLKESIKAGEFIIVQKPDVKVSEAEVNAFLESKGIPHKDMAPEAKLAFFQEYA